MAVLRTVRHLGEVAPTISRLSELARALASVLRPRKTALDPPGSGGRDTRTCCKIAEFWCILKPYAYVIFTL